MKEYLLFLFNTLPFGMGLRVVFEALRRRGKITITGWENLPIEGPVLVVSNHPYRLEYLWIPCLFFRDVKRFLWPRKYGPWSMADDKNFPWWFPGRAKLIPVDRSKKGNGRRALKKAAEVLGNGENLIIFIEGHRTTNCPDFRYSPEKGRPIGVPFVDGFPFLAGLPNVTTVIMWCEYGPNGLEVVIGKPTKFQGVAREEIAANTLIKILQLADKAAWTTSTKTVG